MNNPKVNRNLAEKLHKANVLSNGALKNIPYDDLIIAKIEDESNKSKLTPSHFII